MPTFSKRSRDSLASCDPRLQQIAAEAIKRIDFTVTQGHRSLEEQYSLFLDGKTKCDGMVKKSKHNSYPSLAFDFIPYPFKGWDVRGVEYDFKAVADVIFQVAKELGIAVTWGGDFNGDGWQVGKDNWDKPHIELKSRG